MPSIKVAIAEDQKIFLEGLGYIVQKFEDIELVALVENGIKLMEAIEVNPPDVVLMDLEMPEMGGKEATRKIKEQYPGIKVLLLTQHDEEKRIIELIELGANGYLLKNEDPAVLKEAIVKVMEKGIYFRDYVSQALANEVARRNNPAPPPPPQPEVTLTRREVEILLLICGELGTPAIAQQLYISERTVEWHRDNLMRKAGVKNTAGLVTFAIRNGFIKL